MVQQHTLAQAAQKAAQVEEEMKAADLAKALGQALSQIPAPQVNIDTKALAAAISDGVAKALEERKPREITITKNKDGSFKAKTEQ